ncbi:MAG: ATP-dependent Clp protease ATP-binding subunit, partial [Gemmataceae bacterium]|nr:ATP-dependent Clp protease ATP-binding subunit [Gemmataceae bacterium]
HTLVGAGGAEGAIDASNVLKPALSRGEIQCIGATTLDEYRKYIEKDAALARRFQSIIVNPPNQAEAIEILKGLRDRYETHHRVEITDGALKAAVELSERYISDRCLPDKAIDVIDEAGARVRLKAMTRPPNLKEIDEQIEKINQEKENAVVEQDFEKAAALRDQADKLKKKKENTLKEWREKSKEQDGKVDEEVIAEVVSKMTGVPLKRLGDDETKKLLELENELHQVVVSQHEAIVALSKAIRKSRAGLKDAKRPTGSFIFAGPTGVGKTLLAKRLAFILFGSEDALISLDMSEYQEKHNVARLWGAPPGYVGYEEGGQLTEKIRRRPYSVVLLDEIEKAHPDVWNSLLQIMEEGRLTDSFGRTIDFKNTIIIMTTNIGAESVIAADDMNNVFKKGKKNQDAETSYEEMKRRLKGQMEKVFRPEFLNRLNDVIVFRSLGKEDLKHIVGIEISKVANRLKEKNLQLELTDAAKDFLIEKGTNTEYGARPLRRAVETYLEDPMAEDLIRGTYNNAELIRVDVEGTGDDRRLAFHVVKKEPPAELAATTSESEVK